MSRLLFDYPDCPYVNPPADFDSLVEIADLYDRPLLLTPLVTARKRKMSRRIVLVSLRDAKGRVYLQQRATTLSRHPGLWDVAVVGDVLAGESFEGAALRELEQKLGISGTLVRTAAALPYKDSDGTNLSATYFNAGPTASHPAPDPESVQDGMFVTIDELAGLLLHHQELLTPELAWAVRSGWMVGKGKLGLRPKTSQSH